MLVNGDLEYFTSDGCKDDNIKFYPLVLYTLDMKYTRTYNFLGDVKKNRNISGDKEKEVLSLFKDAIENMVDHDNFSIMIPPTKNGKPNQVLQLLVDIGIRQEIINNKIEITSKNYSLSKLGNSTIPERMATLIDAIPTGAFKSSKDNIKKKVLFIDDVLTNGSTAKKCKDYITELGYEVDEFVVLTVIKYYQGNNATDIFREEL